MEKPPQKDGQRAQDTFGHYSMYCIVSQKSVLHTSVKKCLIHVIRSFFWVITRFLHARMQRSGQIRSFGPPALSAFGLALDPHAFRELGEACCDAGRNAFFVHLYAFLRVEGRSTSAAPAESEELPCASFRRRCPVRTIEQAPPPSPRMSVIYRGSNL